jgi:hypothetical protein
MLRDMQEAQRLPCMTARIEGLKALCVCATLLGELLAVQLAAVLCSRLPASSSKRVVRFCPLPLFAATRFSDTVCADGVGVSQMCGQLSFGGYTLCQCGLMYTVGPTQMSAD